jgi:hypothetical protein
VTLAYPDAFDAIEDVQDGTHGPTGEDWAELADGMGAVAAVLGNLNSRWPIYADLASLLSELRRFHCGIVTAAASAFDISAGGVAISFPAGVFSTPSRIGVVASRVATGTITDADTGPFNFGATSISTSGASIYGYQRGGAVPTGAAQVTVAFVAMQERVGPPLPGGGLIFYQFDPQVYPPVTSGFDEILGDLVNAIMFDLETLTRSLGENPMGVVGGSGSWSSVAAFLGQFDAMLFDEVTAAANLFLDVEGLGVQVVIDGADFPSAAAVEVFCVSATDGADAGSAPNQNLPIVFAAHQIAGGGPAALTFRILGWRRDGANDDTFPAPTDPVTVRYCVRRTMANPA